MRSQNVGRGEKGVEDTSVPQRERGAGGWEALFESRSVKRMIVLGSRQLVPKFALCVLQVLPPQSQEGEGGAVLTAFLHTLCF